MRPLSPLRSLRSLAPALALLAGSLASLGPAGCAAPADLDDDGAVTSRAAVNGANGFDPTALPPTMAGIHFAGKTATPGEVFGTSSGYAVELVYAANDEAWKVDEIRQRMERGYKIILRVDWSGGQHLPPRDKIDAYVAFIADVEARLGGGARFILIGNEGNLDAGRPVHPGESYEKAAATYPGGRPTECKDFPDTCRPEYYAEVYEAVTRGLRASLEQQFSRKFYFLVAGVSPDGYEEHPARWMNGGVWLGTVLKQLKNRRVKVDGVSAHAYGNEGGAATGAQAVEDFWGQLERQRIAVAQVEPTMPIFVTETNQGHTPSAEFVRGAFARVDAHNAASSQDIVALCWFVWDKESWREMSLELAGADVKDAFKSAAQATPPGR